MDKTQRLGQRAVVAGGSLAGLLSARVLADYYDEVVVLDRDEIPDEPTDRRMTPQSRHVHILLKGGERAIEALLPGFSKDMANAGSEQVDPGLEFLQGGERGIAPPWNEAPWKWLAQSRALLEHLLRRRVRAYSPNIEQRFGATVRGLVYDSADKRVAGVEVETNAGMQPLSADLVVDATGRGAAGIRWLSALGLPGPFVEEVKIDFGYTSGVFRLRDDPERGWKAAIIGTMPPTARGSLLMPVDGGLHICSVGGRFGDFPPDDMDGFLEFLATLPQPMIYEAVKNAEIISELETIRYEFNRFRHYERMDDLPGGFIPIGDALCSVNPTYGQGMSSTAKQALGLKEVIEELLPTGAGLDQIAREQLSRGAAIAEVPWRQANFTDFAYPETQGDRSSFTQEEAAQRMAMQVLSMGDSELRLKLFKVNQLVEPPSILFGDPEIMAKVDAFLKQHAAAAT